VCEREVPGQKSSSYNEIFLQVLYSDQDFQECRKALSSLYIITTYLRLPKDAGLVEDIPAHFRGVGLDDV